jgi:hypothetical protein
MVVGAGEGGDGFRPLAIEHRAQVGEEQRAGQVEAFRIFLLQSTVGIKHAGELNILAVRDGAEKSLDVAVNQAGNREAQGPRCVLRRARCRAHQKRTKQESAADRMH